MDANLFTTYYMIQLRNNNNAKKRRIIFYINWLCAKTISLAIMILSLLFRVEINK